MYISLCRKTALRSRDFIGIFDLENTTRTKVALRLHALFPARFKRYQKRLMSLLLQLIYVRELHLGMEILREALIVAHKK